ncbi:hypothetical protein BU25DRAFT_341443 [Macroventuria anomochaeta]|uniref:Uncharacterized protein n=1 Tax=Macroventuria anomochaeta TaxID=301207 RepID=A0ACB6S0N7_9PLEO|nr:uncharacterized protein BU25DRAFT_341443 [Macroventuria anomochaeta]KAF2627706.1 hypothetical protein BU25DRAFT_341443 [Macroventuria anomochaeta]
MVLCPECGAGADLTKDGSYAHCASCMCPTKNIADGTALEGNTIFEPGKEGSHYRGSGSGSGDKEETKKDEGKKEGESKS